jgi:predicted MFS family arabinose efflux permease
MVLVAATVLPHVPANSKGIASGAVFLGLGLGIAGSGTIVPLLLELGLRDTWSGLAVLSAVLTAASWFGWPASGRASHKATEHKAAVEMDRGVSTTVKILYAEYALMAIGLVPAMVFLVDFIARGLGAGAHLGSLFWILYGLGAIFGPPVYGFFADRLGSRTALRALLLVQAMAVAILAASSNHVPIGLVTIVIGTFPPGIVPVVLARVHETIPGNATQQNVVWSRATTVFAAFQALAGYAYSAIFNSSGGNHRVLFVIGVVAIVVGLVVDVVASASSRASSQEGGVAR